MYIDFDYFKKNTRLMMDEGSFNQWLPKASAVLDNATRFFYVKKDIEKDKSQFRANQFKKALCAQIIYFHELGTDTYEGINNSPQSITIGSTSLSNGSRYGSSGQTESKTLLSDDVYVYLENTGLLYRGVHSC